MYGNDAERIYMMDRVFNKKNKYMMLIIGEIILLVLFTLWWLIRVYRTQHLFFNKSFIAIVVISMMIYYCIWAIYYKGKLKFQLFFILIFMLMLALYCVAALPKGIPDHDYHCGHAYKVSTIMIEAVENPDNEYEKGLWHDFSIVVGDYWNYHYADYISHMWNNNDGYNAGTISYKQDYTEKHKLYYGDLPYLIPAAGMTVFRLLHMNANIVYLGGVAFNALFALLIIIISMKLCPEFKYFYAVITFIPIVFWLMSSYSYDCMNFVLSMLLFSYCMYCRKRKELFTWRNFILIVILSVLLIMIKFVYAFIALLIVLIPKDKVKNRNKMVVLVVCLTTLLGIVIMCTRGQEIIGYLTSGEMDYRGIDRAVGNWHAYTLSWVLSHIPQTIGVMVQTIYEFGGDWILNMFAIVVPSTQIEPQWIIFIMLMIFIISARQSLPVGYVDNSDRHKATLILLFCILLILVSMMFSFSTYTEGIVNIIQGVGGRYFVPFMVFFPLMFCRTKKVNMKYVNPVILMGMMIMLNIFYVVNIYICLI